MRIFDVMYTSGNPRDRIEVVTLRNLGTGPQLMDDWRVFEKKNTKTCDMPLGVVIGGGEKYEIRSGRDAVDGVVEGIDGFKCNDAFIWDNNEDEAWLFDDMDNVIDRYCYDRDGRYYCPLP